MREIYIYFLLFLGIVFQFTPRGSTFSPFILFDNVVHKEAFAYYLWQHLILIMVMHEMQASAKKSHRFYRSMFWFQVADTADYWMTNNEVWLASGETTIVTMNMVGAVVCGYFLVKDKLENV